MCQRLNCPNACWHESIIIHLELCSKRTPVKILKLLLTREYLLECECCCLILDVKRLSIQYLFQQIILESCIKIDVYLYTPVRCGRQWKHFHNLEMGCGRLQVSRSSRVLTPEVGSKSLAGWLSSSLTETCNQEGNKYSGTLVWFRILSLDYRFLSNLVKQAVSQGVGWDEMLTKHSWFWAGDQQGKATNAAVVERWILKVRCKRGSVLDTAFTWCFPNY